MRWLPATGMGVSEDWIGKTVGNYRIDSRLGDGGCGVVYRGVDVMLDRAVAVKVLHPWLVDRPDVLERFRSEAHLLARLSHPNVAAVYAFLREGGDHLIVMEYVEGVTIDGLLQAGGPIAFEKALPLFVQALEGIEHAHELGVFHRDIKGSNVMRDRTGRVKLLDFGIAVSATEQGPAYEKYSLGTPEYASPEQRTGGPIDERSDIYSLGVLLFKMLTGRTPSDTPQSSLHELDAATPGPVVRAIDQALSERPADRFETAAQFREALEPSLSVHDHAGTPDSKTTPVFVKTAREDAPTVVLSSRDEDGEAPLVAPGRAPRFTIRSGFLTAVLLLLLGALWIEFRLAPATPAPAPAPETALAAPDPAPAVAPSAPPANAARPQPPVRTAPAEEDEGDWIIRR